MKKTRTGSRSIWQFEKKRIADLLPEALKSSCEENRIQLLPGLHPCDGFFISVFKKKK